MASIHTLYRHKCTVCTSSLGDKCRLTDPTDRSTGTNHLKDLKDHGDQDNRCLFWHCYREIGLNVSLNQWRMAISGAGIILEN